MLKFLLWTKIVIFSIMQCIMDAFRHFVRGVFQLAGVAPTADDADGDACAAGECKADEGLASGVDADERPFRVVFRATFICGNRGFTEGCSVEPRL